MLYLNVLCDFMTLISQMLLIHLPI